MKFKASSKSTRKTKTPRLQMPHLRKAIDRRAFMRASGVAMALPFLDAMKPCVHAADKLSAAAASPRRMVILMNSLSLLPQYFFPKTVGPPTWICSPLIAAK